MANTIQQFRSGILANLDGAASLKHYFDISRNAEHSLRDAMGTAHEMEHCEHYTNT